MAQNDRQRARKILLVQLLLMLGLSVIAWLIDLQAAASALMGGLIALTANALFALGVFGSYSAQQPGSLLLRFYGAEVIKLIFVGASFAVIFYLMPSLNLPVLFGAFILVQVLGPILAHGFIKN